MKHPWRPDEAGNDAEAWRGDVHGHVEAWRGDAEDGADDEAWRGGEHLADWPEASAGPEYWMYKGASRSV